MNLKSDLERCHEALHFWQSSLPASAREYLQRRAVESEEFRDALLATMAVLHEIGYWVTSLSDMERARLRKMAADSDAFCASYNALAVISTRFEVLAWFKARLAE